MAFTWLSGVFRCVARLEMSARRLAAAVGPMGNTRVLDWLDWAWRPRKKPCAGEVAENCKARV